MDRQTVRQRERERKLRGEGIPPKVTTAGGLGLPIVPHTALRTLKVHTVAIVDRFRLEQVTIVMLVILGQVPHVELTMK